MKKQNILNNAFTLVEVLVALTIFATVITSIIWIYISSSDVIVKSDINRKMQENLKNVSSQISEDIRKNGILGLSSLLGDSYNLSVSTNKYKKATSLETKSGNKYYLAKKNILTGQYIRVNNDNCSDLKDHCVIYNLGKGPLTNSFVSVKSLNFYYSKEYIPKLTMSIVMQPSIKKGVKMNLIENSEIIFQTTISERPF